MENSIKNSKYGASPSGWFDMRLFEDWFKTICLPYFRHCSGTKAVIGDNLPSHVSKEVISLCEQNDIKFILLPPNSTHFTQPNDVAVFAPLKKSYRQCLTDYKKKYRGVLPKALFPQMLKKAVDGVTNMSSNIKSGFRATGIIPLNRDQVLKRLPRVDVNNKEMETSLNDSLISHLSKCVRSVFLRYHVVNKFKLPSQELQ